MTTLRWILGSILVLAGGGFIFLSVVGGGFRKSFGASPINPLITFAPMLAMLLMLLALIFPANKMLLQAAAVAAVTLAGLCIWQMVTKSGADLAIALLYLAAWLVFYWQSAWPSSGRG
jgi:phosphatidylglycerophosphate synthase